MKKKYIMIKLNLVICFLRKYIVCRLGFHKWENIAPHTPIPKNGEMICFQNLHECEYCKKQQNLAMGCIM
jgi:hypothetical protein